MGSSHSLLVEKYRPTTLSEYIGGADVVKRVQKYFDEKDIPHILLYGRAGTGKTTLAKIIANNDDLNADVLYINASDENSIETVRGKIQDFAAHAGFKPRKVVILDEADGLSSNAQGALRNMMEAHSHYTRFILTCNYIEKVIDPIQSRCSAFEILPPNKKEVALRLRDILTSENVKFTADDLKTLVNSGYPDIRRILMNTQQYIMDGQIQITKESERSVNYVDHVIDVLKDTKSPIKAKFETIRKILADSRARTFSDLYRALYDSVDEYATGSKAMVILKIAEGQANDAHVVDKEINMMAVIIDLLLILNKKEKNG